MSALLSAFLDNSMPSFSILSKVFLIPAVSLKTNLIPSIKQEEVTTSLVVPCFSLTIDTFLPIIALIRVDFPEFGGPITTTFTSLEIELYAFISSLNEAKNCLNSLILLITSSI